MLNRIFSRRKAQQPQDDLVSAVPEDNDSQGIGYGDTVTELGIDPAVPGSEQTAVQFLTKEEQAKAILDRIPVDNDNDLSPEQEPALLDEAAEKAIKGSDLLSEEDAEQMPLSSVSIAKLYGLVASIEQLWKMNYYRNRNNSVAECVKRASNAHGAVLAAARNYNPERDFTQEKDSPLNSHRSLVNATIYNLVHSFELLQALKHDALHKTYFKKQNMAHRMQEILAKGQKIAIKYMGSPAHILEVGLDGASVNLAYDDNKFDPAWVSIEPEYWELVEDTESGNWTIVTKDPKGVK